MSAISKIQWTDRTWNPVRGCSIVSPGCVKCYAMKQAHRFSGDGRAYHGLTKQTAAGPQWTGKVRTVEDALLEPLSWRKPQRVFVNSMSDLFHEDVSDDFIDRVFAVMALAGQHTFQILTKRASRMRAYFSDLPYRTAQVGNELERMGYSAFASGHGVEPPMAPRHPLPFPNVWLGVSAEDQQRADERIPLLLETPAAVRFVSAEPLLGAIDLTRIEIVADSLDGRGRLSRCGIRIDGLAGKYRESGLNYIGDWDVNGPCPKDAPSRSLDWVIVGGESGARSRTCQAQWILSIVEHCRSAGVPCFVKQVGPWLRFVGEKPAGKGFTAWASDIRMKDRKGGDPTEWPASLRVREFPAVPA